MSGPRTRRYVDNDARLTLSENVDGARTRDEGGPCQAAAWAAAIFLIPISRVFVIFSGVIGPAFSAYVFGVFFRCIFWGGFGGRFGVRCIFLTYFLNLHNINDSSSSTVNATFDAIALKYFHTSSLILRQSVSPQLFLSWQWVPPTPGTRSLYPILIPY